MGAIVATTDGRIRVITIHNEEKRNAVSREMERPLLDAFEAADSDPAVKVVILTGAGDKAFCSGHDLTQLSTKGITPDPMGHPALMKKPIIAAINGHCHAAGLMMAICADIRVASDNAGFGFPAAKLGQMAMGGQVWRLSALMGRGRAIEVMLTGEMVTAKQALDLGLVTHLVPAGQALARAKEIAAKLALNSSASMQAIKSGFKRIETEGPKDFHLFERQLQDELMRGPDAKEGIAAFVEKRRPNFD